MKNPIIYRYVTTALQAVVSLFKRLTGRKESGAKMGLKLLEGGSEIDGRFVNFSNTSLFIKIDPKKFWDKEELEILNSINQAAL